MSERSSVVIVDDNSDVRFLVRTLLGIDGRYDVVGDAGDADSGLELATAHQPDIVLLDVSMPAKSGLEVVPAILETAPSAVVVVLSGYEADRAGAAATSCGAHAYVQKHSMGSSLGEDLARIRRDALDERAAQDDSRS